MYQPEHAGWEQPTPQHSKSSWQQGASEQWQDGNFNYYQQSQYEEVSSGHQGRHMSFSSYGYHDEQMQHSCLNTRLTNIEETQQDIQNMLHQHSQWQEEV